MGLGPERQDKPNGEHFVRGLKESGLIDKSIFSIYLDPNDDNKSKITFGSWDSAIGSESVD